VRAAKHVENGLVTSGDDLLGIGRFMINDRAGYSAADVVHTLMAD
jgi:hypothetical protein